MARALAATCVVAAMTTPALAADPAGAAALAKARAAWDAGTPFKAEPLYREAIEKGGLAPSEVLEGYVRLGAIRAARGKKDQAVAAFRAASVLDSSFTVPREGGKNAPALAARAKRDTARIGSLKLTADVPKEADAAKPFKVSATLDAAHVAIVTKIAVVTKDGPNGKETVVDAKSQESLDLEVPAEAVTGGANLIVRVDALDAHQNRLATVEERVKVGEAPAAAPAVAAKEPEPAQPAKANPFMTTPTAPPDADSHPRRGGGFWSSPWPYVIGGVALASAGTAVYFGTRPPEDVSVGQVGVRTR